MIGHSVFLYQRRLKRRVLHSPLALHCAFLALCIFGFLRIAPPDKLPLQDKKKMANWRQRLEPCLSIARQHESEAAVQ